MANLSIRLINCPRVSQVGDDVIEIFRTFQPIHVENHLGSIRITLFTTPNTCLKVCDLFFKVPIVEARKLRRTNRFYPTT